ncbi:nucleoporin Nup188 [Zophobas morio]|uniref:nucleoporin Nup188 n=1 Tax=Zophobas morio TaxID=2755281 RepID=UPI00308291F1
MSTTPFWKKIHQTVSGYSNNITEDIVAEILKLSKNELLEGLLTYKSYTRQGYDDWIANSNVSSYMKEFVHDLSQDLNLDTNLAYMIMCNYLMFEYYGKIKEFWQITRIGTTIHLKESIWNFYTAERMFLLKTWRHVFEFVNKDYEFAQQYQEFVRGIKMEELQNNLIKQFEIVIGEFSSKHLDDKSPHLENWLCRNIREQCEILSIIILTIEQKKLTVAQLTQLVMLFVQNNFSTTPPVYELRQYLSKRDLEELMFTEIGCYFVILENYWDKDLTDFWKNSTTKELDDCLTGLHFKPAHTIIMLTWLVLKFKSLHDDQDSQSIVEVMTMQPFVLLRSLVSSNVFKNCSVGDVVLTAVHKMLDEFCLMYDDRKAFYEENGVIGILGEILKVSKLADLCLKTRNGLDTLVEIAIEAFPFDFFSFTTIAHSLLGQHSQYKQTVHLLNNVPSFLSEMTWTIAKDEISILRKSQPAFTDSDLIIFQPNTIVRSYGIFGQTLVQYRASYSYFLYLEYLVNCLLTVGVAQRKFDEELVRKVIAGYGVVVQGVMCCIDMDLKIVGLERVIQKLDKMLLHLDGPLLHINLVKLYFDVQNAMMLYRQSTFFEICPEIVWKIFFPKLRVECIVDVKKLLFNQYIFEDTIFMKLFQEEEFKEDHTLLLTYIKILHNIIKVKLQFRNFQLSGIAYLLNFVFIQHQTWAYNDENQKTQITLGCLNIFHYVLQKDVNDLNEAERKIFYLCQHAFLNNIYIIESFLHLFVKEKYHLIFLMERESNWIAGPSLDRLKCIRMQLALLLLIMNQRKTVAKCALNDKLQFVVKPVASYFTNSYSPVIAELSCRFLEKLAQDRYIPLLALLELDHYQVQSLFLERLRDPLEEETVKIAIIDLINTCVSHQNGMTAAFFNLKCFMYWDGTDDDLFSGDSVSDFMVDYLQNIKKSHEYFKNPLQLGILRLLHNLWLNHRENLIDNIANLKDFWPVMVDPFFCDFVQDVEVYTTILKIINIEVGVNIDSVEDNLVKTIDKFLKDKERIKKWIAFVLRSTESNAKNNLDLLSAWMEFLVVTKKVMVRSFDDDIKSALIHSCLNGINIPEGGFNNIESIYLWSQFFLMLTTTWRIHEKQQSSVLNKLMTFVRSLNVYYKYLSPKVKEIVLCLIYRTVVDMKSYFSTNTSSLVSFIYCVGSLIDTEYEYLVAEGWLVKDELEKVRHLRPWLIIIFIGNSLMELNNVQEIAVWFNYRMFLARVMESAGYMLQHKSTLPFAKLAIDFMITYAESPLVTDFLKVDLFTFYYKVRPPQLTTSVAEALSRGVPVFLREWWLICITIVKLNRTLLEKIGGGIFQTCFTFITEHDQLLREIITLTKFTVDMTALTLVCEALKLVYIILHIVPHWCVEHPSSYEAVMDGVKISVNACILSILGYKKINFYKRVDQKDLHIISSPSTDLLVSVLNKIMEIIYWSSSCLRKTKPDPVAQFNTQHLLEQITLLVDNDFSVPRFELPITSKLTYGAILCLADYLCKALNQLSPTTPSAAPKLRQISLTELNDEIKIKSLGTIFEHCTAVYEPYTGFMVYLQRSDDLPNEKLSSFLHYDMSEFSGSTSAISQLDYTVVKNSVEALMTFLACEIFYTMRNINGEVLFSYKRELSSEIQFFAEFVRKRTGEQYHAMVATPRSTTPVSQSETDIIKRYTMTKVKDGDADDIADNNFVLVISHWLMNFCQLSN